MAFVTSLPLQRTPFQQAISPRRHAVPSSLSRTTRSARMTATAPQTTPKETAVAFDWKENWFPVAWTVDIDPSHPYQITLLSRSYTLHYDPSSDTYAAKTSTNESIPIATKFGLIFVYPGLPSNSQKAPLPISSTLSACIDANPNYVFHRCIRRSFPFHYSTILENVSDPAHVPWAHHGSEGNRARAPRNGKLKVEREDKRVLGSLSVGDAPARMNVEFSPPCGIWYHFGKIPNAFFLCTWTVPEDEYNSFLIAFSVEAPTLWWRRLWIKRWRWLQHLYSNLVLDQDSVLIQWQQVETAGKGGLSQYCLASGSWDSMVVEVKRWVKNVGGEAPPGQERLDPAIINDVERWHVRGCRSCSGALRALKVVRAVAVGVFALGMAMLVGMAVMRMVMPVWHWGIVTIGLLALSLGIGLAMICDRYIKMLSYSEIGYQRAHAD